MMIYETSFWFGCGNWFYDFWQNSLTPTYIWQLVTVVILTMGMKIKREGRCHLENPSMKCSIAGSRSEVLLMLCTSISTYTRWKKKKLLLLWFEQDLSKHLSPSLCSNKTFGNIFTPLAVGVYYFGLYLVLGAIQIIRDIPRLNEMEV
jgi:hypothetical protein